MTLPAKEIQLRGDSILQLPFVPPASLYGAKLGDLEDVDDSLTTDGAVVTRQPDGSFALEELPAGLGAPEWGDLIGTLADQTDLAAALAGKAATAHTHAQADITNLVSDLAGKAATSHTHTTSQVTGLDAALAGKAATAHTHAQADITNLVSDLAGKAATSHTHTTSQVTGLDAALAGKAATAHTHAQADITNLVSDLAGKAATAHTHAQADITNLVSDLAGKAATSHTHTIANVTNLQTTLDALQKQIQPAIQSDRYFFPYAANSLTTRTMQADRLFLMPLIVPNSITATRIGINVSTGVAGLARLGIYADGGGNPSGAPLVDAGTVDTSTTGEKEITISLAMAPGLYWIGLVTNAASILTAENLASGQNVPNLGATSGSATSITFAQQIHTFGPLPTISGFTWNNNKTPVRVWIRTP